MAKPPEKDASEEPRKEAPKRSAARSFPWILLLALLASLFLFWGLPAYTGEKPVEVQFVPK